MEDRWPILSRWRFFLQDVVGDRFFWMVTWHLLLSYSVTSWHDDPVFDEAFLGLKAPLRFCTVLRDPSRCPLARIPSLIEYS